MLNRRRLLEVGALSTVGLTLPDLFAAKAAGAGQGRAKSCIFIFLWGGPSHLDTLDMKPDAPAEVRGEFQPIPTNVPGMAVCEHLPLLAKRMDKVAVIRSLSHDDAAHLSSGHATVTGHLAPVVKSDQDPPSENDTPHIGAVLSRLRPTTGELPGSVMVPWKVFHPAAPGGTAPGQHGGWLGKKYDPFLVTGDPNAAGWNVPELALQDGLTSQRMMRRQELLSSLDQARSRLAKRAERGSWTGYQEQAFGLLTSKAARDAFDLSQEPDAVRECYGRNIHGQSVLLARRLIERGVSLVSVNWHNDGQAFWDTHGNNFNRLKNNLLPPADRALAALLDDLSERNLLEETLIAWVGEFGRNPKISQGNAGREHWPFCYSGVLAGGGIRGGVLYGSSDSQGGYPREFPVTPQDYLATVYEALGVAPDQMLPDILNRPRRFCEGRAVSSLLG
jgi:hypothetical protein